MKATFFVLSFFCLYLSSCKSDPVLPVEDLKTALLDKINALRSSGCQCGAQYMAPANALAWNDTLATTAASYAKEMYTHNFFSHISPSGTSPIQRAAAAGYQGDYVGEDIARGYATTSEVVEAWKNSEEHCIAMMDTLYKEAGGGKYGTYWVLDLGRNK